MFALLKYSVNPMTECKENLKKTIHDTRGTGFMNILNIYLQSERAKLYHYVWIEKKIQTMGRKWSIFKHDRYP